MAGDHAERGSCALRLAHGHGAMAELGHRQQGRRERSFMMLYCVNL